MSAWPPDTLTLAAEHGIPAVLTNGVRYADPGRGEVADVLDAARLLRRTVACASRRRGAMAG